MCTNLWEETLTVLQNHGKTWEDVCFVCGNNFCVSNFEEIAKDTNYDSGYGAQQVAFDLKVVGEDWWLERAEYDGAEWWKFKEMPVKPLEVKTIKRFVGDHGWSTIKEINFNMVIF